MEDALLEALGLAVFTDENGVVGAELALTDAAAFNPLTNLHIEKVAFSVMSDRLIYIAPPELVGAPPVQLAYLKKATKLEDLIVQTLSSHLMQVERRSSELSAMGVSPQVDPATLRLSAELARGPFKFALTASRSGDFRVSQASRDGVELTVPSPATFELSEFRDRRALEDFLYAMFSDNASSPSPPVRKGPDVQALKLAELFGSFGEGTIPARTPIEIVCELKVKNERYRFAAARVQGRTFRGLLAGPTGKVWAERFELEEFFGIRTIVAHVLAVSLEEVELVQ